MSAFRGVFAPLGPKLLLTRSSHSHTRPSSEFDGSLQAYGESIDFLHHIFRFSILLVPSLVWPDDEDDFYLLTGMDWN